MEPISRAEAKRAGGIYYFTGEPCAYGHIAKRTARNYTCVECESTRARGDTLQLQSSLPTCRICGAQVRAPGHATCSSECKQRWDEAKTRAKRELKKPIKLCHGCGAIHHRHYKWFCSDECHTRHTADRHETFAKRECLECGTSFYARRGAKLCSTECRKRRQHEYHIRQRDAGYIAELSRKTRSKVAAAVAVAKELGIMPPAAKLPRQQRKRRLEREKYAVMLTFKQMGLLQQEKQR